MQTYLVGGAVRDKLLGIPVSDRDWVVVGATPAHMTSLGYQQVGNDFPVFLHPESGEEYALARTERKSGTGYTGFVCDSSAAVTLEQDLIRRDLTINAMAIDDQDNLVDPYGGEKDLKEKVLRHVSDTFVEDPLRVLRVARFAARYHQFGFSVAEETMALMTQISRSGELSSLSAERVWKETSRSLQGPSPHIYFEVLRECGALSAWLPELASLWGIPNPAQWHPEIDTGLHSMMVLQQAARLSDSLPVRYAALVHDLGKALTDPAKWPSHRGHEKLGLDAIEQLSRRLKVPNECKELALLVCEYHTHLHRAFELKASTVLQVLNKCDAWRRPERFEQFILACKADARGRTGFEDIDYSQSDYFRTALAAANACDVQAVIAKGAVGSAIREGLEQMRIAEIKRVKSQFTQQT